MLLVDTKLGSSGHRGLGLFAKQRIAKGTKIWTFHPGFDQEFEPAAVDAVQPPAGGPSSLATPDFATT